MKVSLVGAGPGDPGLLTVSGRNLISKADVIIYDALANPAFLEGARKDAELIYAGKIADQHALKQDKINELLVQKAREDKNVVRLKGGDPYIFGRGGEEALYLEAHGIPFEIVPGVSSAIAAPAYAGIPLTHRGYTSSLTILTGHENPEKISSSHNWKALSDSGATLVIVMGVRNIKEICANLMDAGMRPDMPSAIIYRGTTPLQKSHFTVLSNLAKDALELGYANPSIIVIGEVVKLHESLDWFSDKPLLGKRIVVTRARVQASGLSEKLSGLGADVIESPAIEIAPLQDYPELDEAFLNLEKYAWIIFTSVNGVKYFWERLELSGRDSRALSHARIAAIGPSTADALKKQGIIADFVPASYVAEEVAKGIITQGNIKGKNILLPRAVQARMTLPDELAKAGAVVDVAGLYETIPGGANAAEILHLLEKGEMDCITFASSSTVRNFFDLVPPGILREHPETALAVIGPITAATLEDFGLVPDIKSPKYTIPGLVEAITAYYKDK